MERQSFFNSVVFLARIKLTEKSIINLRSINNGLFKMVF